MQEQKKAAIEDASVECRPVRKRKKTANAEMNELNSLFISKSNKRPKKDGDVVRVKDVPRNRKGNVVLPIQVSASLAVFTLGRIDLRSGWHNKHCIMPLGYKSCFRFKSMKTLDARVWYFCEIADDDGKPLIRLTAEDMPDKVFTARSASETLGKCLTEVRALEKRLQAPATYVDRHGHERPRGHTNEISGARIIGLSHPTVQMLVQNTPASWQCAGRNKYLCSRFL